MFADALLTGIMQFVKLATGEQLCHRSLIEKYSTSKPLNVSPEKSLILSCDTVVANERYVSSTYNMISQKQVS